MRIATIVENVCRAINYGTRRTIYTHHGNEIVFTPPVGAIVNTVVGRVVVTGVELIEDENGYPYPVIELDYVTQIPCEACVF